MVRSRSSCSKTKRSFSSITLLVLHGMRLFYTQLPKFCSVRDAPGPFCQGCARSVPQAWRLPYPRGFCLRGGVDKWQPLASHRWAITKESNVANRLDGKVAAVTGGDQGIARAIVERLAAEGADVALCFRSNQAGADEVVAAVQKSGRQAAAFQCDVGKVTDGQRFITEAARRFGRIDILVNNAGLERRADFW